MTRILFIPGDPAGAEEHAARDWLRRQADIEMRIQTPDELVHTDGDGADVIWLHAGERVPELSPDALGCVSGALDRGAGLFLSLFATPVLEVLGLERSPPNNCAVAVWHDASDPLWPEAMRDWPAYPHIRGLQGWAAGSHPLFDGFMRGTFTWRATEGERVGEATCLAPRWPVLGRVVAVERGYIQLNAAKAVAWEYAVGGGRVLCVGAHIHFAARDASLAPQRDRLVRNALAYVARHDSGPVAWWPVGARKQSPTTSGEGLPVAAFGAALPELASAITLTSLARADDPFTIAGRRVLVTGGEQSGVREIWVHPLCVLSGGLEVRVDGETPTVRSVEVSPEQLVRHLQTRTRFIEERIFVPVDEGAVVIEYRFRRVGRTRQDVEPPRLELRLRMPLRLEWPYPADALRPVKAFRRDTGEAASIAGVGRDPQFAAQLLVEGQATLTLAEDDAAPRVTIAAVLAERLRLTMLGTSQGLVGLSRIVRALSRVGVRALAAGRADHAAALLGDYLTLRSPNAALDTALEWAKARLDAFVVTAPGVGSGLMAGYAESRPGWNESRPGYAWFFGRDGCWSGFALLAAGLHAEARVALEFLAGTQDISGKIAHEVTASGAAHYDAADATPLWLKFVAEYAAWTGDVDTVRALWPRVERALEFVRATDRDGDGLPENTGVGHGWIESGPLGGGAVTSYVAAIWIAALEALAPLAELLGERDTAARCAADAATARRAFDDRLFDASAGRHALQRAADGSLESTLTALSAVPVALGVVDEVRAGPVIDALAEERFTTAWGVRLLARDDPRYDPRGYHSGAVWPLFTGWVSLAEFATHRQEAAYRHLLSNAGLCYDRAKGAFDEVLHGEHLESAGVCADQAWSAAMVVLPFVEGMLGAVPNAAQRRVRLTPHWPREWTHASVGHLRVGEAMLELDAVEGCLVGGVAHDGVRYRLRSVPPGSLTVVLEHPIQGRSFERVLVDGAEVTAERCGTATCPHVRVTTWLAEQAEVQFVGHPLAGG